MELQISKLDAARRQLDTAIRLYFAEADPVSIHTLAAAGHAPLSGVNKARGGRPMLEDHILTWVKEDKLPETRRLLRASANFFKHADRDADDTHAFNPTQAEILLFDACDTYKALTGELVPTFAAYACWFARGTGADLVVPERAAVVANLRAAFPSSRQAFFAEVLPVTSSLGA